MTLTKREEERAKKLFEREKKRFDYQNEYNKKNYDRININVPKGYKDKLRSLGVTNFSAFAKELFDKEIERIESEQGIVQDNPDTDTDNDDEVPF